MTFNDAAQQDAHVKVNGIQSKLDSAATVNSRLYQQRPATF